MKKFLKIYHCRDLYYFLNNWVIAHFKCGEHYQATEFFKQIPGREFKKQAFQYLVLSGDIQPIECFDHFFKFI